MARGTVVVKRGWEEKGEIEDSLRKVLQKYGLARDKRG